MLQGSSKEWAAMGLRKVIGYQTRKLPLTRGLALMGGLVVSDVKLKQEVVLTLPDEMPEILLDCAASADLETWLEPQEIAEGKAHFALTMSIHIVLIH
jgi:hypothetical protein